MTVKVDTSEEMFSLLENRKWIEATELISAEPNLVFARRGDTCDWLGNNWTPLFYVCKSLNNYSGDTELIQLILDLGADVNARSNANDTPLHLYAENGTLTDTFYHLLSAGAGLEAKNNDGQTPLFRAAMDCYGNGNDGELIEAILQAGACVSHIDKDGRTALHYAAQDFTNMAVKHLLRANVCVSHIDIEGKTALHYAAENNDDYGVKYLLAARASTLIRDNNGKLADDLTDDKNIRKLIYRVRVEQESAELEAQAASVAITPQAAAQRRI